MISQTVSAKIDRKWGQGEAQKPFPVLEILALGVVFLIALGLRVWFVFLEPHINIASVSDASEFLRNAQAMLDLPKLPTEFGWQCWQALTSGTTSPESLAQIKQTLSPLKGLYISGPIIPLFFAFTYAVSLTPFSFANCTPPLVGNVILSALTCVFFALTATYAFDKKTGFLAGIGCALYPAFIINSSRLYCETLAAFLLSVVCFLTVRGFAKELSIKDTVFSAFVNGIFAASLQFTRSITVFISLALLPVVFMQQGWRKGLLALPAFLFGFALVALPWLGLQQLTFGSAGLVVDRVGNYNFFMGNHVDGAGFVTFPYEDGTDIEKRPMAQLAKEAISRSPSRWAHLMVQDKPLRLFKMPWNDFRMPLGPVSFYWQTIIHQALLLLAAVGAALCFTVDFTNPDRSRQPQLRRVNPVTPAKVFLLSIFVLHCAYMLFITVPRYNLTVMPIVIVFAAAGISSLVALCRERGGFTTITGLGMSSLFLFAIANIPLAAFVQVVGAKQAAIALTMQCTLKFLAFTSLAFCLWQALMIFAGAAKRGSTAAPQGGAILGRAAVAMLFVAAVLTMVIPARGNGRWDEWQAPVTADRANLEQQLVLPKRVVNDLAHGRRSAYLLIDTTDADAAQSLRVAVNGQTVQAPVIAGNAFVDQNDFTMFAKLPEGGFMREGEWVFRCLTEPAGISNADLRQWFMVPLPAELISGKPEVKVSLANNRPEDAVPVVFGSYSTRRGKSIIPGLTPYSWEKTFFGVENDRGFCDTRYDTKLAEDLSVPQYKDMSPALGLQSGRYNVRLLMDTPDDGSKTTLAPTPVCTLDVGEVRLSKALAPFKVSSGELPAIGANDWWLVRVRGSVRRLGGEGKVNFDVRAASADNFYRSPWAGTLSAGENWRTFDTAVPLMPGKLRDIMPNAITCQFSATDKDRAADTEFKNVQFEILHIPGNPLARGYEVF